MLKAAGIFFVIAGTAGLGNSMRILLKRHLQQLLEWQDAFIRMELDKKGLRLPYGQMLRNAAMGKNSLFGEIAREVAADMETNREADVGILWEKVFEERKRELLFSREEKEILISLARNLAMESSSTKACEIYFYQLKKRIDQVMEEKREKQRLYSAVGVLGGLFLVILLL